VHKRLRGRQDAIVDSVELGLVRRRPLVRLAADMGPKVARALTESTTPDQARGAEDGWQERVRPLRCAARSGVRSPNSAPINPDTSASISCPTTHLNDSRTKSTCSSQSSRLTTSSAVMLCLSAIVVSPLVEPSASPTIMSAAVAETI
jgi:hypothetical protein